MRSAFHARRALLPSGWAADVRIACDARGVIAEVTPGARPEAERRLAGHVVPGVPNLHSHSFQRAMAGRAERRSPAGHDSFWTWREAMYRVALRITPEQAEAVAAQLQAELLARGFTQLVEFHYLHHQPDGTPFDEPAEMALRQLAAAEASGMGVTLAPSLYRHGGIFGLPAAEAQRRFLNDADGFARILGRVRSAVAGHARHAWAVAPHSLRAVSPAMLAEVASLDAPLHLHIAEQPREVEECLAATGQRPVEWLLDHAPVDRRWCLIHATHMTARETERLAATGAVAGLCPTTEASLGDGTFALPGWLAAGGRLGLGTDSHVGLCPAGEMRQLETSQRLRDGARSVAGERPGRALLDAALTGGAQAAGVGMGALVPGLRCDLVELDDRHPCLLGAEGDALLDAWTLGPPDRVVRTAVVAGRAVVEGGRHIRERSILDGFERAMRTLWA